jgi:hypothetical protein
LDAEEWAQAVTERARQWVHDADVPEAVRELSHRVLGSTLAERFVDREDEGRAHNGNHKHGHRKSRAHSSWRRHGHQP